MKGIIEVLGITQIFKISLSIGFAIPNILKRMLLILVNATRHICLMARVFN